MEELNVSEAAGHASQEPVPSEVQVAPPRGRLTWPRKAVALTLLLCCCLIAYWRGTKASRSAFSSPEAADVQSGLVADSSRLDFGAVWEDPRFEWVLPLTNITDRDIKVTRFFHTCDCSAIEPESLLLRAGERVEVKLTLDLTAKRPQDASLAVRDFEIGVRPEIRGAPRHPGWSVRGRVRSAVALSERSIDFGEELVVGQPFPSRTIKIKRLMPLAYLVAGSGSQSVLARMNDVKNSPSEYELEVKPEPSLPAGAFACRVKIQAAAKDGKKLPPVWLPVKGTIGADVQAIPAAVHFGAGATDSEMRETIGIRSFSGKAVEIEAVELPPGSGLTVAPIPGAKKDGLSYIITQRVREQGHKEAVVKFRVRVAGGEVIVIPVKVTYYGVARSKWQ